MEPINNTLNKFLYDHHLDESLLNDATSYLEEFKAYQARHYYNYFSESLRNQFDTIKKKFGTPAYHAFQKITLAMNVNQALCNLGKMKFPMDISELYESWFRRIVNDLYIKEDSFYTIENDLFVKDMGIAAYRIIPAGAQIFCISGVPRSFLKSTNPFVIVRGGWFILTKMKKFRPFVEIHTDNRWLHEFNPDGWNNCYLRIAQYLKMHPDIRGMVGGSWFYDPQLEKISPHLTYLRKIPQENGAGVFNIGVSENSTKDALFSSKTRRNLYNQGRYVPTRYLVIWCREDLLAWSARLITERAISHPTGEKQ